MMTYQQFLLNKLAEEASEIAQIALKTSQFGMDEVRRNQPYTNKERIHQELDDLNGIISMLNEDHDFNYVPSAPAMSAKRSKVTRYMGYSAALGKVKL